MKRPKVRVRQLRQLDPRVLRHYLMIAQVHQAHKEMLRLQAELRGKVH